MSDNKSESHLAETLAVIARIRKEAGMSQAEVAAKIRVDKTRISKIEKGVYTASHDEIVNYLDAIGSSNAKKFSNFLRDEWRILERPSFDHPHLVALRTAEVTLQELEELRSRSESTLVSARLDLLKKQLLEHAEQLRHTTYKIAFIGDIGVGKTTVVCVLAGLVIGDGINDIVLETGPGRTTLCDVQIEEGNTTQVLVVPHSSDEVMEFARDFCEGIWARHIETEKTRQAPGVSREIDRALRNMCGLARPRRQKGKVAPADPAIELAKQCEDLEAFISAVWLKLDLARRTLRDLNCPPSEEKPLRWLTEKFRKVNNGRHPKVSLPRMIRVVIPRPTIDMGPYTVRLVDTKGLDSTLTRPDLRSHRDDDHTLVVVCTGFKDAPSASSDAFLRHAVEEGAKERVLGRAALMVLPKFNEAMSMKDDAGYHVRDAEEGYELRQEQVEIELSKINVGNLPIWFVDATRALDVERTRAEFRARLDSVVKKHVATVDRLRATVVEAKENHEQHVAEAAHERFRSQLRSFLVRRGTLPSRRRTAPSRLLEDLASSHPRTVWASARRKGLWKNLHAPSDMGAGAAVDAKFRSHRMFDGLKEILENMLHDPDMTPAHRYIQTVLDSTSGWERAFIEKARVVGVLTYRGRLIGATEMWKECRDLYGEGHEYRNEVSEIVERWFDEPPQEKLQQLVDQRLAEVWEEQVINPLRAIIGHE